MSLSKQEQEEFNRVRHSHNGIDQKTYELCLHYYLQYKHTVGQINTEKMPIVMKTALYVAQKSQFVETVNGERIFQPSMTLSNLLKTHQPDQVMITLKHFHRDITIEDKVADREVANLVKDISFFLTFYKKFDKVIRTLDIKERHPETGNGQYLKNLSSLTWLFYIHAKKNILKKSVDTIDNTCLLAHTVAFVLCCAWDYILPKAILASDKRINEQSSLKEVMTVIRDKVLEMFLIKSLDIYTPLAGKFEDFFDDLTRRGVIKSSGQNDFMSPDYLPHNYKKVDKLYERNMGASDLDERIFYRERLTNLTPSKFTPFARQGYANKGRRANNENSHRDYNSHRILNYEQFDKIEANIKNISDTTLNMTKLPKNVIISPSTTFKPKLLETPISTAMEGYNYVQEKVRKARDFLVNGEKRKHEKNIMSYIMHFCDLDRKNGDKKSNEIRQNSIYQFFKWALEEYLIIHPNEQQNEQIYLALTAVSIEIGLWINNSTITFDMITDQVQADSLDMWKACDFFIHIDRSMPNFMRCHLIDLEAGYLGHILWRDACNVQAINKVAMGQKENYTKGSGERLMKKLLLYTANTITMIGNRLGLEEQIVEQIFTAIKTIFLEYSFLLEGNHIDQLIMCSFYAFTKLWQRQSQLTLKFQEIIENYREASQYNKDIHDQILNRFPLKDIGENCSILDFYNKVYVPAMKMYIRSFKSINPNQHKRHSNNPHLMSPLKQILPRDLNRKNLKMAAKDGNTNLLISYTDSPLLKHEAIAVRNFHHPKTTKMINFEHEETQFKDEKIKQYKEKKQYEKLSPRALNTAHDHTKKSSAFPWKTPQQQPQTPLNIGLTPTRTNKTVSAHTNFQLNQFTSNPTPPASAKMGGLGPMSQKPQLVFGKSRHYQ